MLRHKATIQCARIAFSLAGIFDPDEAERIAETGETEKPQITRPTRASEAVIDAQTSETNSVSAPGHTAGVSQTGGASASAAVSAGASPANNCFCSCCKSGKCDCQAKDEFNRCGCGPCKFNVAAPPAEESKTRTEPEQAPSQPSGSELFGPPPGQGRSEPEGPYLDNKKYSQIILAARTSGVEIKDDHTDAVHLFLLADYGITSVKRIPIPLFKEVLNKASNIGPVKVNAK
jgi:hypothetical protein